MIQFSRVAARAPGGGVVFFVPTFLKRGGSAIAANMLSAVSAAILIGLFFAPTQRQAAIAAWVGVAILVFGVGILS